MSAAPDHPPEMRRETARQITAGQRDKEIRRGVARAVDRSVRERGVRLSQAQRERLIASGMEAAYRRALEVSQAGEDAM